MTKTGNMHTNIHTYLTQNMSRNGSFWAIFGTLTSFFGQTVDLKYLFPIPKSLSSLRASI